MTVRQFGVSIIEEDIKVELDLLLNKFMKVFFQNISKTNKCDDYFIDISPLIICIVFTVIIITNFDFLPLL